MATSGTYLWSAAGDDLLTEAWERLRKSPALITGDVAAAARRSMQYLLIDWANDEGVPLWRLERLTATLTLGQATVTLDPATVDVLDMMVTWQGQDLPVLPIGRTEYQAIANKAQTGRPVQAWCERLRDAPVLHLYPVPDQPLPLPAPQVPYVLSYYRIRQPQDVGALANNPDVPVMWHAALAAGLAEKLAEKYAGDLLPEKQTLAAAAYARAKGENRERVPLRIMPRFRI